MEGVSFYAGRHTDGHETVCKIYVFWKIIFVNWHENLRQLAKSLLLCFEPNNQAIFRFRLFGSFTLILSVSTYSFHRFPSQPSDYWCLIPPILLLWLYPSFHPLISPALTSGKMSCPLFLTSYVHLSILCISSLSQSQFTLLSSCLYFIPSSFSLRSSPSPCL